MITVDYPGDRPRRLGLDQCPGIDERGHGLAMRILHDGACCAEWEAGQTPYPSRAAEFQRAAERWGSTWPKTPAPEPEPEAENG